MLESIRKHYGPADKDADSVKLSRTLAKNLEEYLARKAEKSALEAQIKKLEEQMKSSYAGVVEELGVSCRGVLKTGTSEYEVTYNPMYRTGIDKKGLEKLKINHPDVYDDYVSVSESRRFSVKKKEAA